jgi:hypothetical protein
MKRPSLLLLSIPLACGTVVAQDLNFPDGVRVVKVQGTQALMPVGDANGDGIDDLGRVNPRASSMTGNCLLVVPGAISNPAVIVPATSGGQFCSQGSSDQELGPAMFGTNFCGSGTNSIVFGYNGYHNGFAHTMPKTGTVTWQTIFVCNNPQEKHISNLGDLNGDGSDDLWFGGSNSAGWLNFGKRPENGSNFCTHSAPAPSNVSCSGQVIRRLSGNLSQIAYRLGDVGGDLGVDIGLIGSTTLFGLFSFSSDDLNAITAEQGFKMSTSAGSISSVVGDIDLNGDGLIDIAIGLEGADSNGLSSNGRVYIAYGRPEGFPFETDLDADQSIVRIDGVSNLEFLGKAMTSLDFDGNGVDDIVVPGATGSIYVLFGHASRFVSGPVTGLNGQVAAIPAPAGQTASLSSDFDFNDDGLEDFGVWGPVGGDYYIVLGRSNGLFSDSFEQQPSSLAGSTVAEKSAVIVAKRAIVGS